MRNDNNNNLIGGENLPVFAGWVPILLAISDADSPIALSTSGESRISGILVFTIKLKTAGW